MKSALLMLVVVGWTAGGVRAAEWEEVRQNGRSYVTAASLARFYKLGRPVDGGEQLVMAGEGREVRLRLNSREAFINGRKTWLSFACVPDAQGRALVSRADVVFLFDPVLRRGAGVPGRAVKGVVIDPGHGGQDRGAQTRSGYTEKAAALDTSLRLEKILKERGMPVVMTRRTDVFISLEQRAAMASRHEGYIFVSMHYNAGPAQSHGVETYSLSPQGTPSTSAEGRLTPSDLESHPGNRHNLHNVLLSDLVHREMAKMHSPAGDRGTKRARFVVLREVMIPGILVEGGFMTHRVDGALIQSAEYRQKVAQAVARGIEAYVREVDPGNAWLGVKPKAESSEGEGASPAPAPAPRRPAAPLRKPEDIVAPPPSAPDPTVEVRSEPAEKAAAEPAAPAPESTQSPGTGADGGGSATGGEANKPAGEEKPEEKPAPSAPGGGS